MESLENKSAAGKRARALLRFALAEIVALAAIWWLAREPWRPETLPRAIPAESFFVTAHERPIERLPLFLENAAIRGALAEAGIRPPHADREIVRRCLGRKAMLACFPDPSWPDEPAYAAVFWLGPWARLMRWRLELFPRKDVPHLGTRNGHVLWRFDRYVGESDSMPHFAFAEGALLLCVSRDEQGLRRMLSALDGNTPSAFSSGIAGRAARLYSARQPADTGWVKLPGDGAGLIGLALESLSVDSARVSVHPEFVVPMYPGATFEPLAVELESWLGDAPAVALMLPASQTAAWAAPAASVPWARAVNAALLEQFGGDPSTPAAFFLLTGELSGGFGRAPFRARIPAVLAAARAGTPDKIRQSVGEILDAVNARYRTGLILNASPFSRDSVSAARLEYTVDNPWLPLAEDDLPAFALYSDLFFLSSNARSLENLMRRAAEPGSLPERGPAEWLDAMRLRQDAAGCLWLDIEKGGQALESGLTLWKLQAGPPDRKTRQTLKAVDALVKTLRFLRPFGSASCVLTCADGKSELVVNLGPDIGD